MAVSSEMVDAPARQITKSAAAIMQNNAIQTIVTFFSVIGLFVMGAMAAENVAVTCGIAIPKSTEVFSLQTEFFDAILPGLLPLAAVMLVYLYLKKRKGANNLKATLLLLAVSAVFGALGILC